MVKMLWFNNRAKLGYAITEDGKTIMIKTRTMNPRKDDVVKVRRVEDYAVTTQDEFVDTYLERFSLGLRKHSTR